MILRQEFGRRGRYEIDLARYLEVASRALCDASGVLGENVGQHAPGGNHDHNHAYKRYVYAEDDLPNVPRLACGAPGVQRLVKRICAKYGFDVRFVRTELKDYGLSNTFISWIWVKRPRPGEEVFTILYNGGAIEGAAESILEREKLLGKILLHEGAHGVLHHQDIVKLIDANPANPLPSLEPKHEPEAWLYALLVWGILVGDHAFLTQRNTGNDAAWMLA